MHYICNKTVSQMYGQNHVQISVKCQLYSSRSNLKLFAHNNLPAFFLQQIKSSANTLTSAFQWTSSYCQPPQRKSPRGNPSHCSTFLRPPTVTHSALRPWILSLRLHNIGAVLKGLYLQLALILAFDQAFILSKHG